MPRLSFSTVMLAAVVMADLAVCTGPADPHELLSANPTPYESVLAMISKGADFPAAGDDLTLYLSKRFDDALAGAAIATRPEDRYVFLSAQGARFQFGQLAH